MARTRTLLSLVWLLACLGGCTSEEPAGVSRSSPMSLGEKLSNSPKLAWQRSNGRTTMGPAVITLPFHLFLNCSCHDKSSIS